MFDTLFLLVLVCLLTLRLSINIKHLCFFFYSLPMLIDFLKFRLPSVYFDLPPRRLLNLTKISNPPFYFDPPPFIRHLRVSFLRSLGHELRGLIFIFKMGHFCSVAFIEPADSVLPKNFFVSFSIFGIASYHRFTV